MTNTLSTGRFALSANFGGHLHPMSELPAVEAEIDEMIAGLDAKLAAKPVDHATIWANYNRNKGTPLKPVIDAAEVERRITGER
jgi:hypothetical protein